MGKKLDEILGIIATIGVVYAIVYVGYELYEDAKMEEQYFLARDEINSDLLQTDNTNLDDIIKVNCERYMKTQSDEFYCITKYKSEN